ncbi:phytanoyl-CoA dioxygenase family protein [Paenibacillus thermotolerans]|uniref:phytanoyl-CoA dioxygenase family protein n=1 Tax=Paenibacillus thermotolerans TaxID=3027807 RepID=UPI00236789B4|nr:MULTISPECIES: phytanoyl-CoA dioxygenase family protein [unclassified Paenibacillus]
MTAAAHRTSQEEISFFKREGYLLKKGLFEEREIEELKALFMEMHAQGPVPGYFHPVSEEEAGGDILRMYPRVMHPHRFNGTAMRYMIHPPVMDALEGLFGEQPLAAQSMFYFKPPGAKGQALHQDNFYLKVEPGTCIAAWVAVDRADEENGTLFVVPKTQEEAIQCPKEADPEVSFTRDEVTVPEGLKPIPVILEPGDVLFFNGSMIHGSYPNRSNDRFRRAFICHYTGVSATKIGQFYQPMYRADGTPVMIDTNTDSGPCGTEFAAAAQPH